MDYQSYIRAILALTFVLGLIGITSYLLKRFHLEGKILKKNEDKRLSITEIKAIDARRRLVLIKRDDVEHLILIGQNSELVIEKDIKVNKKT